MYNLILKDFLLQKKITIFGLIYCFSMVALAINTPSYAVNIIFILTIVMLTHYSIMYCTGYDEKNKADYILNSLPTTKEELVYSRYMSLIFFTLLYCAMFCIYCAGAKIFMNAQNSNLINFRCIFISITISIFIASLYYPLFFKFGTSAVKYLRLFIFLILVFLPTLTKYYAKILNHKNVSNFVIFVQNNSTLSLSILGISAILIMLISLKLSINIYKNKDI